MNPNTSLFNKIWSCPSGKRLIQRLHEDLKNGKNAVCVLPKHLLVHDLIPFLTDSLYQAKLGSLKVYSPAGNIENPALSHLESARSQAAGQAAIVAEKKEAKTCGAHKAEIRPGRENPAPIAGPKNDASPKKNSGPKTGISKLPPNIRNNALKTLSGLSQKNGAGPQKKAGFDASRESGKNEAKPPSPAIQTVPAPQARFDQASFNSKGANHSPGIRRPHIELVGPHAQVKDLASLLKIAWSWETTKLSPEELKNASLEELFEAAANDDRLYFLALTDLESFSPAAQTAISEDLKKWAEFTLKHGSAGSDPVGLRLLALVSPLFPPPKDDLKLAVHYWWAKTDFVDNQIVFSDLAEKSGLDESALARYWWLKALCQGFCHDDFVLMGLIFDNAPTTVEGLIEILAAHPLASIAEDYRERVAAQPAQAPPKLGETPPLPASGLYQNLWAEGLLLVRPVSILHPLLMEPEALVKAINAGQRQVLLPLVDSMQSFLVAALEAFFDPLVWERYEPDEENRPSVIAEIGRLTFFINYRLPTNLRFTEYARSRALCFAHPWRKIRNTVAHNKMVSYAELEEAFDNYLIFYDMTRLFKIFETA